MPAEKIKHLSKLSYNKELMLSEIKYATFFVEENKLNGWEKAIVKDVVECTEVVRIYNELKAQLSTDDITARYYIQRTGNTILPHTDGKCHTSINIVLSSGSETIYFGDSAYAYTCAILNVGQHMHQVHSVESNRILVRYPIYDTSLTFQSICNLLN